MTIFPRLLGTKIVLIYLLIISIAIITAAFSILILQQYVQSSEEVAARTIPISQSIQGAVFALEDANDAMNSAFLTRDLINLHRVQVAETNYSHAVLDFQMFNNIIILGSDSEEFQNLGGGILHSQWHIHNRHALSQVGDVQKADERVVAIAIDTNEKFKEFNRKSQEAFSLKRTTLRLVEVGNIEEAQPLINRIEVLADEIYVLKTELNDLLKNTFSEYQRSIDILLEERTNFIISLQIIIIAVLFIITIIVFFLVTNLTNKFILTPISKLSKLAEKISAGKLTDHVYIKSKDELGALGESLNTMTDSLKDYRSKLEHSISLLDSTLESTITGILVVDREGKIIKSNDQFAQMWNIPTKLLKDGDDKKAIAHVLEQLKNPDDFVKKIEELYSSPDKESFDELQFKDGKIFERFSIPQKIGDEVVGRVWNFYDVTKEKEVNKMKDEFLSMISHQLRSPLVSIKWIVSRLVEKEEVSEEGKEQLRGILSSSNRLVDMIGILLDVSRIESGLIAVEPEPIDVVRFVKDYIPEIKVMAAKKDIKIIFKNHPDSSSIMTDKSALQNILQSIISNAIEYTEDGGEVEISLSEKDDMIILFSIRDTGIGIPKNDRDTIFDKFTRASNAKDMKAEGTGLGLYIAREAAKLLGGNIWFESEENVGTTFHIELPIKTRPQSGVQKLV